VTLGGYKGERQRACSGRGLDSVSFVFSTSISTGIIRGVCYTLGMPNKKDIKKIRSKHGMTQVEFARAIGVSPIYVSMMECGSKPVTQHTLKKIARALGETFVINIK
jgi:DNA-binding XRE family transcriptional regulator